MPCSIIGEQMVAIEFCSAVSKQRHLDRFISEMRDYVVGTVRSPPPQWRRQGTAQSRK